MVAKCQWRCHSRGSYALSQFVYLTNLTLQLAYKPLVTPILKQIQQLRETGRPWVPVNGLEVLPEQGIAQFQLMTGRTAPRHLMRSEVMRNHIGEERQYMETSNQGRPQTVGQAG